MSKMQYETFTTNDKTTLAYQTSQPLNPNPPTTTPTPTPTPTKCILLLHGFSGSSAYFSRNHSLSTPQTLLLPPDLRGHGRSQQTQHGYHVARLATDLHDLLTHLHTTHPTIHIYAVGCSIGAAVLWTYIELFTDAAFMGLIFVDQAPLQDRSVFGGGWGPTLAHAGCYDEATTLAAQSAWSSTDETIREETYRDLVRGCLGYRHAPREGEVSAEQSREDEEFFTGISRVCDGVWLARLLGDHTRYDHREGIELISVPVLVLMGRRSGCFSVEGMEETVRRVRRGGGRAEGVVFESGHWLFWEEAERFNATVAGFVEDCEGGSGK